MNADNCPGFVGGNVCANGAASRGRTSGLMLALAAIVLLMLPACVTRSATPTNEGAVAFALLPPQSLQTGSQATLAATVANDSQNLGVNWVASCQAADCGSFNPSQTLDGQGTTYTAPKTVPAGCGTAATPTPCVSLTAKSVAFPAQTSTVSVAVFSSISISLTGFPASPLAAGSTTQITAVVAGDPSNAGVNWTLSCSAAACGTITPQTASGAPATYTAPASVAASLKVTINAIAVAAPSPEVTTSVTVTPVAALSISFPPLNSPGAPPTSMNTGATAGIIANVANDSLNEGVDWTVTCTGNSGNCGTFNPSSPAHTASGIAIVYTAPASVPVGGLNVTITAAATASADSVFVSAVVAISAPVVSISPISGAPTSMVLGTKATLSATVTNDNGSGVDWSVTCTPGTSLECGNFSGGTTIHTASGQTTQYTAPTSIPDSNSQVTITAKSTLNPSAVSTATITINPSNTIAIAFVTGANAPPSQMTTSAVAQIAANVTNDTTNAGVDWSLACTAASGSTCGAFSGSATAHTASGAAVSFTAPTLVPTNGSVTITATATATEGTATVESVSATITIQSPAIQVTITNVASSTVVAGATDQITAEVSNDPTNAGVTWSATCTNTVSPGDCGSFNPPTSTSGNNQNLQTSYTSPSNVSAGGLQVTITATAVASSNTATATATVTVNPNPNLGLLTGQYAFSFTAPNESGGLAVVGSVTTDGAGNITGGEEDANIFTVPACQNVATPAAITGGTYTIGTDGRGTMTITTGVSCLNGGSGQTLNFILVDGNATTSTPATHALLLSFNNTQRGSGTLDLQTPAAFALSALQGGYAYTLSGIDTGSDLGIGSAVAAFGGVFTVTNASGSANVTQDENDQDNSPAVLKNQSMSGTLDAQFSGIDASGRGTASFNNTGSNGSAPITSFVYYVVNSGYLKFMSDSTQDTEFVLGGSAYSNQSAPGFSGQYVFTVSGVDASGSPAAAGGSFTGTTGISGVMDSDDSGAATQLIKNAAISGTINAVSGGRGTLTITPPAGDVVPAQFAYYPTASRGILLFDTDTGATDFVTAGVALPQIPTTPLQPSLDFTGIYAMTFTGFIGQEEDATAQVTATNNGTTGTLAGASDVNRGNGGPTADITTSGSFTIPVTDNGRDTGQLVLSLPTTQTLNQAFYVAGPSIVNQPSMVLFLELDSNGNVSSGRMEQQTTVTSQ